MHELCGNSIRGRARNHVAVAAQQENAMATPLQLGEQETQPDLAATKKLRMIVRNDEQAGDLPF